MSAESDFEESDNVKEIDAVVRRYMKAGKVPNYIARDYWVGKTIRGGGHELEVLVAPDYFAIGTDADPFRVGKSSQTLAQEVADHYDSILPSQKLLAELEAQADVKIPYIGVQIAGRADDSVAAVVKLNDLTNAAFEKHGVTNRDGLLKIGYSKSYVTRPGLDGKYIAIYGGRWSAAGGLVQPTSGRAHTEPTSSNGWEYSDASHHITLVSRKAKLDDEPVDLVTDVFLSKDPSIYGLVSNEGRFNPEFPNVTGTGTIATMAVDRFGGGGSGGGSGSGSKGGLVAVASVEDVQKALMAKGYSVGSSGADGKLGPDTAKAIKKFQSDHGLPMTGTIDEALRKALGLEGDSSGSAPGDRSPLLYKVVGGALGVGGALLAAASPLVTVGAGVVGFFVGDYIGKRS